MEYSPRKFFTATILFAVLSIPMIASAALVGRLPATPGGTDYQAYYDDEANLTWLADASANGQMNWDTAKTWARELNINEVTGWRLPTIIDTGAPGCTFAYTGTQCGYDVDTSTSEIASLFYDTLGNLAYRDTNGDVQPGGGLTNTGPFSNVQDTYWTGTGYAPITDHVWLFSTRAGRQYYEYKAVGPYAWAVQSGDVGAVPVPAAVWLFGSGLIGLFGASYRKA